MQQYQEGVVEAPFGDLSTYVSTARNWAPLPVSRP